MDQSCKNARQDIPDQLAKMTASCQNGSLKKMLHQKSLPGAVSPVNRAAVQVLLTQASMGLQKLVTPPVPSYLKSL